MRVSFITKREAKAILTSLSASWKGFSLKGGAKEVKKVHVDEEKSLIIFKDFRAVQLKDGVFPFLEDEYVLQSFPWVAVDRGAIPFICSGANIMRPGIKEFHEQFRKGDLVVVREEGHQKAIAVGIAQMDSREAIASKKGAVLLNGHYIGDGFWQANKELM